MLAFYMDHQFSARVTRGLRARGISVLTAFEDGSARAADELILTRATDLDRVLVTHDKGFLKLAADRQRAGSQFPGIAFVVQESLDIGKVIEYLELMAHVMSADEMRNCVVHVPTRK